MKKKYLVSGMTCAACSAAVERAVEKLDGVQGVAVSLMTNSMQVELDPNRVTDQDIIQAVDKAGYGARTEARSEVKRAAADNEAVVRARDQWRAMRTRLIVSISFMLPLMYIAMGHMVGLPLPGFLTGMENAIAFSVTQFLLTLPIVYVNRNYYIQGYKLLFRGHPNMDTLIALGSSAALIYGVMSIYFIGYGLGHQQMELVHEQMMNLYFESCAMILTLITVGKALEARSRGKTSEALTQLMDLRPAKATVLRDGEELEIPAEEIQRGDVVVVRPGGRVPADGVILTGRALLDQSALTGESMPVEKEAGDKVACATINRTGSFTFRAEKVGEETSLHQIIRLVEDASASKAPIARLADKISGIFVPIVLGIAILAAVIWWISGQTASFAVSTGIAVLVISCPCALGLATPVAIMVGTGKGAQLGILYKSAEALERLHEVNTILIDKTGTATEGRPRVAAVSPARGVSEGELIEIAAALEKPSEHPLAEAILTEAARRGITPGTAEDFEAQSGFGVHATVKGQRYHAGNARLMESIGVKVETAEAEALANAGVTPLYFARQDQYLGMIGAKDPVKPTSREAVKQFREMGVDVVLLTGDNRRTAEAVAKDLGITEVVSEVLPQDKEREVRTRMEAGRSVAMIGDGINDAPALARADVGIAIGAGTDIAMESADVVLIKSDLMDAVNAVRLSRRVMRNIRQNLFWAFFYNAIGIPLAAGALYPAFGLRLDPMIGAAAMSLSSVSVVTNALRLRGFKPVYAHETETVSGACPVKIEEVVKMKRHVLTIEGMMCEHCLRRVTEALNGMEGVSAEVDLQKGIARVTHPAGVSADALKEAVEAAGYSVTAVEEENA